jgi:hypothetical protein
MQLHAHVHIFASTEVIAEYDVAVTAPDDVSVWSARVCARPTEGNWEGWIEFDPLTAGHVPVRTPPETTQVDRDAMERWAVGLTPTYLEGALERARERPAVTATESAPPLFDEPAPVVEILNVAPRRPHPILDPYAVHAQGEQLLVDQLAALDTSHLRDIVLAYEMTTPETAELASRAELTTHILAAVHTPKE